MLDEINLVVEVISYRDDKEPILTQEKFRISPTAAHLLVRRVRGGGTDEDWDTALGDVCKDLKFLLGRALDYHVNVGKSYEEAVADGLLEGGPRPV